MHNQTCISIHTLINVTLSILKPTTSRILPNPTSLKKVTALCHRIIHHFQGRRDTVGRAFHKAGGIIRLLEKTPPKFTDTKKGVVSVYALFLKILNGGMVVILWLFCLFNLHGFIFISLFFVVFFCWLYGGLMVFFLW